MKKHRLTIQFNNELQYAVFRDCLSKMERELKGIGSTSILEALREVRKQVNHKKNYEILKQDYDPMGPMF